MHRRLLLRAFISQTPATLAERGPHHRFQRRTAYLPDYKRSGTSTEPRLPHINLALVRWRLERPPLLWFQPTITFALVRADGRDGKTDGGDANLRFVPYPCA